MERLIQLHKEMKHLCMLARIGEKIYDSILAQPELLPALEAYYKGPYTSAKRIRDLLPEDIWVAYKNFGMKDLREIKMLREAFTLMKNVFYRIVSNDQKSIQEIIESGDSKLQGR